DRHELAAHLLRRVRLHVERLLLGWAAEGEDDDTRLDLLRLAGCLGAEELRQCEADRAQGANVQELTTMERVVGHRYCLYNSAILRVSSSKFLGRPLLGSGSNRRSIGCPTDSCHLFSAAARLFSRFRDALASVVNRKPSAPLASVSSTCLAS